MVHFPSLYPQTLPAGQGGDPAPKCEEKLLYTVQEQAAQGESLLSDFSSDQGLFQIPVFHLQNRQPVLGLHWYWNFNYVSTLHVTQHALTLTQSKFL